MNELYKYPRTQHIEGSGIQQGDEDLDVVSLREFAGRFLVVEEKMDGANSAISFTTDGHLQLQSRGHYLSGGEREKQFHLLKTWAHRYTLELWEALSERYIMYGEWLYAKHTIFYTDLPHYFMEFDILDKSSGLFLSTARRQAFLRDLPFVSSVKVLYEGSVNNLRMLKELVGPSHFMLRDQKQLLAELCAQRGLDFTRALKETDTSGIMEGLYIKVEEEGVVKERYKYVRNGFLQTVFASESHWIDRPLLPNYLQAGRELF
ncbi:MAG TPA: RNA ligase family protein [Ktedonobacteraceae bacterium]